MERGDDGQEFHDQALPGFRGSPLPVEPEWFTGFRITLEELVDMIRPPAWLPAVRISRRDDRENPNDRKEKLTCEESPNDS